MTDDSRTILVVDDEPGIRDLLGRALAARGFTCHAEPTGRRALARLARHGYPAVIADLRMPDVDGLELLRRIKETRPLTEVIIITGAFELASAVEAMRQGAYDYVTKPFRVERLLLTLERALHERDLELAHRQYRDHLEAEVELRTLDLAESNQRMRQLLISMLETLASTLEAKDPYTHGHSERVAAQAVAVAAQLQLSADELQRIELAGLLHDIGKIAVREAVLHKRDRLTDEETEHIQAHAAVGERMLADIDAFAPILESVRHHHERVDGAGYPDGLGGGAIPLAARILSVCDAYDAMTSDRPYRSAYSPAQALEEIGRVSGSQFDPAVAEAFRTVAARHTAGAPQAD